MKKYSLLLFMALSSAYFYADAAETRDRPEPRSFSEMDTDNSGYLTMDEVSSDPFLSDKFSELDTDSSGSLTEDELKVPGKNGGQGKNGGPQMFETMDTNGDGELSQDEVADDHFLSEHFDDMDADNSGTLSQDEMRPPKRS